jgi:hypothetical protein
MGQYPIASHCPQCGSASFTRVRVKQGLAFTDDRKCKDCGTRYTPPTPTWAAVVFIVLGCVLMGGSAVLTVVSVRLELKHPGLFSAGNGFFLAVMFLTGLPCFVYGIRSLKKREEKSVATMLKQSGEDPR